MSSKTIVAIMYDFDKTLSPKDMQEYAFTPDIGMDATEFWTKCNNLMHDNNMDSILAYMYFMVTESKRKGILLTRDYFRSNGKDVRLFEGVTEWFSNINKYAESIGVQLEHYVISSGLKEIIEGTPIAHEFKEIYAAEFCYDDRGEAAWASMAVNYTSKTQFIYRINKGVLSVTDHRNLNESMPDRQKRIPFRNMIYIGDGLTDVPCMKLVKSSGGHSVAVYQNRGDEAFRLLQKGRVSYVAKADYTANGKLYGIIKAILDQIKATDITTNIYLSELESGVDE